MPRRRSTGPHGVCRGGADIRRSCRRRSGSSLGVCSSSGWVTWSPGRLSMIIRSWASRPRTWHARWSQEPPWCKVCDITLPRLARCDGASCRCWPGGRRPDCGGDDGDAYWRIRYGFQPSRQQAVWCMVPSCDALTSKRGDIRRVDPSLLVRQAFRRAGEPRSGFVGQ